MCGTGPGHLTAGHVRASVYSIRGLSVEVLLHLSADKAAACIVRHQDPRGTGASSALQKLASAAPIPKNGCLPFCKGGCTGC